LLVVKLQRVDEHKHGWMSLEISQPRLNVERWTLTLNLKTENAVMAGRDTVTVSRFELGQFSKIALKSRRMSHHLKRYGLEDTDTNENVDDNILTFEQENSQAISSQTAAPASGFST
jgi:hypothetical protein